MSQANLSVENGKNKPKKQHAPTSVGKGFFTMLVLCLIAVGGVAVTTFNETSEPSIIIEDSPTTTAVITTKAAPAAVTTAKTTTTTAQTVTTTTTSPLFVLPLSDKVLTPFSEQPRYSETLEEYRSHKAVDFDGEEGEDVYALTNGTVASIGTDALFGGTVTIDHGAGIRSIYCGITPAVEKGQEIKTGDTLGKLRSVPCESELGPHLHLELYKDGKAVDPSLLLHY